MPTNERLVEACMAVLQATKKQELGITLLNKALFYSDLIALRDLGETITGATYVALKAGPVVDSYGQRIVEDLRRAGLAVQVQRPGSKEKPVCVTNALKSFAHLSEAQVAIASDMGHEIQGRLAVTISELTHSNPGWQVAYKPGEPGRRINMLVAMQQVVEKDPWIDEEPDEEFRQALEKGSGEGGIPL